MKYAIGALILAAVLAAAFWPYSESCRFMEILGACSEGGVLTLSSSEGLLFSDMNIECMIVFPDLRGAKNHG